jgi:hypothetical protein
LPDPCALLTNARVAVVLGLPVATRSLTRSDGEPTCTWASKPLGYMQVRQSLSVGLFHATRAIFDRMGERSIPPMTAGRAGSAPAFDGNGSFEAWKDGVVVDVEGGSINVYLGRTIALVQAVLARIHPG